jgi:hypothetical protein
LKQSGKRQALVAGLLQIYCQQDAGQKEHCCFPGFNQCAFFVLSVLLFWGQICIDAVGESQKSTLVNEGFKTRVKRFAVNR